MIWIMIIGCPGTTEKHPCRLQAKSLKMEVFKPHYGTPFYLLERDGAVG